ncbi:MULTISPECIES: PspC domain-containing protein [Streptomyces]|uniref:PspC domain-containing protein n=1 Tax=Streptomyces TaxID=1883 RepID=UPI0018A80A01|nr:MULTISPECIES: PspC domain-containing protein [Streptomyces]MBF8169283.1 PspC domain-containing protein [Streptomyces olivaceus]MBZ6131218.1 PspC domain-containing protein [Streptomyces olivaceus]MCU8592457.1 PspC domain-containing protein [Streptomyces sp. A13(2022)]
MTDHEHAATGPGPGSGPRPPRGAGPQDAAPAADVPGTASGPGVTDDADAPGPPQHFRRDRRYKTLAGVCAGLGRQCDLDPVIFRITLAVLSATGGIGLLFYGFAWLFVPYDDEEENEVRKLLTGRVDGQALAAVLFALVGCGIFLTMLRNGGVLTFAVVLSLLLAGAGYWSRHRRAPEPDPLSAQTVADAPPEAQAPPIMYTWPSWWRGPIVKDGTHDGGTGYLWGPSDAEDRDIAAAVAVGRGLAGRRGLDLAYAPAGGARHPRRPQPRGPRGIGGWVFLLAVLAGFLGTRLTWDDHPLGTSLQTGLACALAVFGLGIAVSAFLGRTGAGSVFLAIITAGLLAGSAAVPKDVGTEWSRTTWAPAAVADVREEYQIGAGSGTVDLSRLDLTEKQTVSTRADVGIGRIRIVVPRDATVRLSVSVGVGDIRLPGDEDKDVDVAPGRHKEITLRPTGSGEDAGTLDLDLQVGIGQAEVTRAAS